jgi:hypothetical protein
LFAGRRLELEWPLMLLSVSRRRDVRSAGP